MSTICVLQAAHHVYQTHDSLHTVLHTAPNSAIPNCEQVSIWAYYNQEQVDLLHVIIERYQGSRRISHGRILVVHPRFTRAFSFLHSPLSPQPRAEGLSLHS